MHAFTALFQFLAFDVAWASAVAGGAGGWPWLGIIPALAVLALHLFVSRAVIWAELRLVLAIALFGILLETGFTGAGLVTFVGSPVLGVLPLVEAANVLLFCTSSSDDIPAANKRGLLFNFQPLNAAWAVALAGPNATSNPVVISANAVSICPRTIRPKKAVKASEPTASAPAIHCARSRRANGALLIQPPTIEPRLNAARNVEISHAQTMSDEPKKGLSSREARSWKPMLRIPSRTTST